MRANLLRDYTTDPGLVVCPDMCSLGMPQVDTSSENRFHRSAKWDSFYPAVEFVAWAEADIFVDQEEVEGPDSVADHHHNQDIIHKDRKTMLDYSVRTRTS